MQPCGHSGKLFPHEDLRLTILDLRLRREGMLLGLTAVLVAYFLVWLPGPAVGLRFLGFEIGEWIKFLGVGMARNYFYLPPITLGLMLALWTAVWPTNWKAWLARGTAVAVSLLAFPAVEAVLSEPPSEWLLRLALIGLVTVVAAAAHWLGRWPHLVWILIALLGLAGGLLPGWEYGVVRPLVAQVVAQPIGIGIGVWLNGAGHLLAAALAMIETSSLFRLRRTKK